MLPMASFYPAGVYDSYTFTCAPLGGDHIEVMVSDLLLNMKFDFI